jgi:hypothetical protein
MKHHREGCDLWKNRADAVTLMVERRRKTRHENSPEPRSFEPCPICHRRPDHHDAECPHSQAEKSRRDSLRKHDIDPDLFEVFLRVLGRKYD